MVVLVPLLSSVYDSSPDPDRITLAQSATTLSYKALNFLQRPRPSRPSADDQPIPIIF